MTRSVVTGAPRRAGRAGVSSFAPGVTLADRYRVERLVGRGGMGEVYEAWDGELSILVALKTLRFDVGREREALWRLKREVLLARSVAHPHVCRVYDLGRHGDGPDALWFLTMEFLQGETLRESLQRRGPLSTVEALPLVEQMAAGLGAGHRAGVVHRDFKSGNVMLVGGRGNERAVVADFGVARAAGTTVDDEGVVLVGTPAYMAPEQVLGEEVGPPADIYALGVVLYEIVTGRLPFAGGTALEVARRRLVEEAPSPRNLVVELDERWEAAILRCLSREPGDRFEHAEEVAEALARGAPAEQARAPAPRVRRALPAERDAFVGREVELEELDKRLSNGSRLVTLLGAGGMGKTRLALRYGWRSVEAWPGGVWFCDLTEARNLDGIASAVARSLGVPLGKGDPVDQLGHAIAGRGRCLVILDNFEQVVDEAGETLGRWLERAEEARFVVTSRERLNLRGEVVQAVDQLSLTSSIELFVERARRLRPGLEVKGPELESVRHVARLVDGMPLAIELAAARVRVMTPSQLVERMQEQFHLLAGGSAGRHATLRAAIDGSWELLRPWEKSALAQCSVFEGGFTLEAAEGVLDLNSWPEAPWVLDVVQSLVDKSLLKAWVPESTVGAADLPEARFGMYVSVQEYAQGKLEQEGAIPDGGSGARAERAAEERHGKWYALLGTNEGLESFDQPKGLNRRLALGRELENLIAACRRAVKREDGLTATAAYLATWAVLERRGPFRAATELGDEVFGCALERNDRARVLTALGQAKWRSGRTEEACVHFETALAIQREVGDPRSQGLILGSLANVLREQGRMEEARAQYEVVLAIHREVGNRRSEGTVLGNLANVLREQGQMEESCAHFEAALAIHREIRDRRSEGIVLGNLGILLCQQGRMDEARTHYEAALAIYREVGDRFSEGVVLGNLGIFLLDQGWMDEARVYFDASLAIHRELGNRRSEGIVLGNLGLLDCQLDRMEEARARFESALAIDREVGNRRDEATIIGHLGLLHYKQGQMEEARTRYETALAIHREVGDRVVEGALIGSLGRVHLRQGRMNEAREAITQGEMLLREAGDLLALSKLLCARVELELRAGDAAAARAALGEAEALATQIGAGPDSELGGQVRQLRQSLGNSE